MLHDVLLALSGHPSPLFHQTLQNDDNASDSSHFPCLSPSERDLLQTIGKLSELHRKLRTHLDFLSSQHRSIICRATATSLTQVHLARFQQKILDVERKVLTKDASTVGAYDIVPLAGLVDEFDGWHRLMAWYWDIATFMQRPSSSRTTASAVDSAVTTGAALIDRLRAETQTGYPEIEEAAIQLSKVAETAWLRQLASWLLYGKLATSNNSDFFVQPVDGVEEGSLPFRRRDDILLPRFVTPTTAASIWFVGKSLYQVRQYARSDASRAGKTTELVTIIEDAKLTSTHLQELSSLALPILPAQLSRTVSSIQASLSRDVLGRLLPLERTLEMLRCLRQFFLLQRGEFATTLIAEADSRLQSRQHAMGRALQQDPVKALQGLSIKNTELAQTLHQVWKTLALLEPDDTDEMLLFAQEHITLKTQTKTFRPSTSNSAAEAMPPLSDVRFDDLLFPMPTTLVITIPAPLDLIITEKDTETYSAINAYLLSIRRALSRTTDLWRNTPARRVHPSPTTSQTSTSNPNNTRAPALRKVWATASSALFLLTQTSAYLEGEIIPQASQTFETWLKTPTPTSTSNSPTPQPPTADPTLLSHAHRLFLSSLTHSLLLTSTPFTTALRQLLTDLDAMTTHFTRLLSLHGKMATALDTTGSEDAFAIEDARRVGVELDRARKRVDAGFRGVLAVLRAEGGRGRGVLGLWAGGAEGGGGVEGAGGFVPWTPGLDGGVEGLLMKLEFLGRVGVGGGEAGGG